MATKKSNKNLLIIIAVVLLGVCAVAAFLMFGKNKTGENAMQSANNGFSSIRDALSKSVSLECEYTDANSNTTSKYWVKNGAIRADIQSPDEQQSGSMIMKDKTLYTWKGTEGFMMTIPDVTGADGQEVAGSEQTEDLMNDLEEYKQYCKPAVVSDSLFTPPSEVQFSDTSKMMQGIPSSGNQMTEQGVKKMMEQYQNQEQ